MSVNFAPQLSKFPDIEQVISLDPLSVDENTINTPFCYLQLLPSNNDKIRSKLLVGFNEKFFHIDDDQIIGEIGAIIETLHGASLLIDDIEDDSTLRRGNTCAHIKYGIPAALNSGNLMYFVAIQKAFSSLSRFYTKNNPNDEAGLAVVKNKLLDIFMEEMVNLHTGQGYDIYWRDNLEDIMRKGLPTIEEYLKVVMHKTGGLFRLAVRILSLFSCNAGEGVPLENDLMKLANLLGIIYQVRDDHLNLVNERYAEMKGFAGEDLIEGKLSLPILYTLLHTDVNSTLYQLYTELKTPGERRSNIERIQEARQFIVESGALEFSFSLLQEYVRQAKVIIESVDDDSSMILSDILDKLSQVSKPTSLPMDV